MTRRKRQRRTAEEAREQILDATAAALEKHGPGGIRLTKIAKAVGISHPTILHHFGNREGLIKAVVQRGMDDLSARLIEAIQETKNGCAPPEVMDWVFQVFGDQGYARQLAWLALSGEHDDHVEQPYLKVIADVIQPLRASRLAEEGKEAPPYEDTLFVVLLSALSLFGASVVGEEMFRTAGLSEDEEAPARFRTWAHKLLMGHLEGEGGGCD